MSMVPTDKVGEFLEMVQKGYYFPRDLGSRVDEALFATQPGAGAAVYRA